MIFLRRLRIWHRWLAVMLGGTALLSTWASEPPQQSVVWAQDEGGLKLHFVYGLAVTNAGTVLAFCEGRIQRGDAAPHHIVLKRSADRGRTWGENILVARSKADECYANPTPVVDRTSGRIFVFYALNEHNQTAKLLFRTSDDDGRTWSEAADVTFLFDGDPYHRPFRLPGPGHGIQIASGRLIIPIWHRLPLPRDAKQLPPEKREYGASVIYSDDGGRSWKSGGYTATGFLANESRVVALRSGELLLSSRTFGGPTKGAVTRVSSRSGDGGVTWSEPQPDKLLGAYWPTDCGLIRLTRGAAATRDVLVFSHPDDLLGRSKLTVSISMDGGRTWQSQIRLDEGGGYSDLVEFPDGSIGVLYGAWAQLQGPVKFARLAAP